MLLIGRMPGQSIIFHALDVKIRLILTELINGEAILEMAAMDGDDPYSGDIWTTIRRYKGEKFFVTVDLLRIDITYLRNGSADEVILGIDAPREVRIERAELTWNPKPSNAVES